MVDLVGEVLLAFLGQEVQPGAADDLADHVQVPADAAVHIVHDHALLSHVVLDDHDAVGSQPGAAPLQEVGEVVVGEVSWGGRARVSGCETPPRAARWMRGGEGEAVRIPPDPSSQNIREIFKGELWGCPTCVPWAQPSPGLEGLGEKPYNATPYPGQLPLPALPQPSLVPVGLDGERTGHGEPLTDDPLDPDDIVGVGLGAEVLEAAAEVVAHPPALLAQVAPGLGEEILRHVHHVHRLEEGQQQPLGDAADARPAVQSAGRPRPVGAILGTKTTRD